MVTPRLSRERRAASVVIRRGHAAPRTGPQPRPGNAALAALVGRTAASAAGAFAAQGWTGGRAWPLPGRLRMPAWPKHSAGLAGYLIVKSGRGSSAAFAAGKGSSTVRKAVSLDHNVWELVVKRGVG